MAKTAIKPADTEPADTPEFDFEPSFDISVPADLPKRAKQSNALPFKDMFARVETAALEGKQPHYFIPNSWWINKRNVPADKFAKGSGYTREKVRNQFNDWVKADPEKRKPLRLLALDRTGKEDIPGIAEPGLSFWLTAPKTA